jgi:hypothetical protein
MGVSLCGRGGEANRSEDVKIGNGSWPIRWGFAGDRTGLAQLRPSSSAPLAKLQIRPTSIAIASLATSPMHLYIYM